MSLLSRVLVPLLAVAGAHAQVSSSAYRVLGQTDLHQNGLNLVQGVELNQPSGIAIDPRGGQTHLYISDSRNSRVLAWADTASYQIGDAPTLVLGQPGPQNTNALGIGTKGFNFPQGIVVNPVNGDLYVADFGNNRVVRFLAPFANTSRIEPDAVIGQPNFNNRTAGSPSPSTLNQPRTVAFDPAGNLWVVDAGNHRVLRFNASVLNGGVSPAADTVVGQRDFFTSTANAGGSVSGAGFDTPNGLAFDAVGNLYVSDGRNSRVLRFAAPLGPSAPNPTATTVWGQSNFTSRGVPAQPSSSTIAVPAGLGVGGNTLYVASGAENRVLTFPLAVGGPATGVLGQTDFATTTANTGSTPLASANSLFGPNDVKLDATGNLFVVDTGNNRLLQFAPGAKAAAKVWGQIDFVTNGPNQIKPASINFPFKIAVDYSSAPYALYVSDTGNNRVLGWKDSVRFRNGDPADFVIGQPNLRTGVANVDTGGSTNPSNTSLSAPEGLAVDPNSGTLYVADSGNNRVLRYRRPVNQSGRIAPEAVLGQADFTSSVSAAVNASSLNSPAGLAFGPNGDLFVADAGNNRVLEFPAGAGTGASAIRVFGQPSMTVAVRPSQISAQTLANPLGITVDTASNLYVVDSGASRVIIYPNTQNAAPSGVAASFVVGQSGFGSTASGSGNLKTPTDVAVDSMGNIYVADSGNNRVLIYGSLVFLPAAGAVPTAVVGQSTVSGTTANWNTSDGLATAEGLYSPIGVYIDRQDTLYVGDAGNNRVVQFLKPAAVVNAATYQGSVPVARGSLAALFGNALSVDTATVSATTWPTFAANRQLVINDDLPAPLYYVGPSQVNFQVPSNAPLGSVRIAVRTAGTGELVAGGSLLVAASAPGIFTSNQAGTGQAAVVNQDGTINSTANPALIGSTILIYGTGQGQVSPAVADGTVAPGSPLANTVAVPTSSGTTCLNNQPSMCVAIGSTGFGDVKFSGLAPGYIGLWQINVVIPQGLSAGSVPVRVLINGTPSNTVTVAVR
jgi:uncharacterized protein (TIGR03437 family)